VIPQKALDPAEKWGPYLRGPDVFFQTRRDERQVPLGQVASLRRGLTTGANDFFYLTPGRIHEWQIDERLTRPLLKSPKEVQRILVAGSDVSHRVLSLNAHSVDDVSTPIGRYVGWGESLGLHQLRTCARRPCWYSLLMAGSDAPQVAVPKGIWRRHAVLLLEAGIEVDQQFYLVQARPEYLPVIAALLTSSWAALQIELFGRRNFGLGVLWLAATDLLGVRLPDPRHIGQDATAQLVEALDKLAAEPLRPLAEQVAEPARQSLDTLVFDLLGLTAADRQATVGAAVNLAEARMQRAASG